MYEGISLRISQTVRADGQLSQEVIVSSGVAKEDILCPLMLLAYVNVIWINTESNIRLFADDCIIHR